MPISHTDPIGQYKKVSIALMGNKNGRYNKGKKKTLESRLKISRSMSGENNPRWKGGVTSVHQAMRNSIQYKEWRNKVYKRDKYTCQECGDKSGGNLEADHINLLSTHEHLAYEVSNGRTLCKSCHRKRHKK